MKTKLVSLNAGIKITIRRGKKDETIGFTGVFPSVSFETPEDLLQHLCDAVNVGFGTGYTVANLNNNSVSVLKPKRISRPVVDTEKIIKELV